MKVTIDEIKGELTIKVPLTDGGTPSRSGSTTVIASTRGNQYLGEFDKRPIYLQLNLLSTDRDIQTKGREGKPIPMAGIIDIDAGREHMREARDLAVRKSVVGARGPGRGRRRAA